MHRDNAAPWPNISKLEEAIQVISALYLRQLRATCFHFCWPRIDFFNAPDGDLVNLVHSVSCGLRVSKSRLPIVIMMYCYCLSHGSLHQSTLDGSESSLMYWLIRFKSQIL